MTAVREREEALERWAAKAIESAPPFTDEQRAKLARMLSGGGRR